MLVSAARICRHHKSSHLNRWNSSSQAQRRYFTSKSERSKSIWQEFAANHRPTWAEIDLDHVAHNVKALQARLPESAKLIAVVKADGYGHGAEQVGKTSLEAGAHRLAVAVVEEGILLRRSTQISKSVDIHVLGLSAPGTEECLLRNGLIPTIGSIDSLKRFAEAATRLNLPEPIRYHLKIDTGMGRVGILPQDLPEFIDTLRSSQHQDWVRKTFMEGVFTHFSKADELDKTHCRGQIKTMGSCVRMLEKAGLKPPMIHSANSAGIIDSHLLYDEDDAKIYTNTYRMGISMYGFYPSEDVDKASIEKLKPTMTWKTKIVQLKELTPGHTISYGGEYITSNPQTTRIATLPVGYADGYRRRLGRNKPLKPSFSVLVGGKVAPIVGRVCMDMCHIDVTHIPEVSVGAEVVLMGRQGKEEISGDLMAAKLKTINYEITCLVGKRVPRLFKKGDEFVGLKSIISDVTVDPNSL